MAETPGAPRISRIRWSVVALILVIGLVLFVLLAPSYSPLVPIADVGSGR